MEFRILKSKFNEYIEKLNKKLEREIQIDRERERKSV